MTIDIEEQFRLYGILYISVSLLFLVVTLLLTYMVIRLAITHGMLSYSRQMQGLKHGNPSKDGR